MAFCAICGRYHDPGVGCLDGTRDVLRETKTIPSTELSGKEFKRVARQADRWLVKVLLWALVVIVQLFLITSFVRKTY